MAEIGVGMLGYAFMGKAHSFAFRKIDHVTWPPPLVPRLVAIAGRNEAAVAEAARRYGYERWTTDWRDIVADDSASKWRSAGSRPKPDVRGRAPRRTPARAWSL